MKKLLFILMLISIVSNCLAQVVSTTDLCNTEWVLRSPNCDGCKKFIAFTLSHKTDKVFFVEKQKTYNNKFDYYISPTIPTLGLTSSFISKVSNALTISLTNLFISFLLPFSTFLNAFSL